ncbi:hypothetical protein FQN57_004199 [Myotisia sp. PD_48]|nr:hypothetical protein FQN57_004199 [Myotisia sp. PD_48]
MALLQTIQLAHLPPSLRVHVALYTGVKNASFLREQLIAANSEYSYAFIDASMIGEAFRRFGITDSTTDLLVIKISTSPEITHESVAQHLDKIIDGSPAPFENLTLDGLRDLAKIRKAYKLPAASQPKSAGGNVASNFSEEDKKQMEISIIGAIALRGS